MQPTTIVLLGPYQSGKSTMRRLLAEHLTLPHCSLHPFEDDALLLRYFIEGGYEQAQEHQVLETEGAEGMYRFLKPFEAYAVERCLQEHPGHIVELGPTLAVYEDPALFRRVQEALAPAQSILLMPSSDREASFRVLRDRAAAFLGEDRNDYFVTHPSNRRLATLTVYTEGKTPEATRDEILQVLGPVRASDAAIVLIGPPKAGKSTLSNLLAASLSFPQVGLDVVGWDYAHEAGLDEAALARIHQAEGERAARRYEETIWAGVLERVLAEHPSAIVDCGAGHSVYETPEVLPRVEALLAPHRVILLLPSPDLEASIRILRERPRSTIEGVDANKYLIDHPSMCALAQHVVYTDGKTPEESRDEILERIERTANGDG